MPSSSSTENGAQAPVFPEKTLELLPQVSAPNSPGRGIVWNTQTFFPVRASNAMMSPLGYFWDFGTRPFSSDVGMTTMLPETKGGDVFMRCPTNGLKLASFSTSFVRSTTP